MAYTVQDFINAYNNSQYKNQVSSYDYNLGIANPEQGMQILAYKSQWNDPSATAEQRALLNSQAEAIRQQYGGTNTGQYAYTGGSDGSQYNPIIPSATQSATATATQSTPYQSQYQDEISSLLSQISSYPSFSYDVAAPTYTNRYDPQIQQLVGDIVNRQEFSYDKSEDPNWSAYAKQYRREGELASRDALAAAAARSGGLQSSSAVSAAQQAGNYYASKLSDILPELYKQAYDRYTNEYQMKRQALGDVYGQEQADYSKYLNELGQYNTDRSFAYTDYANQYNMLGSALGQYQGQDATEYNQFANQLAYDTDAARYQDSLIQQAFTNALATRTANENTAQLALENQRYDTEYANQLQQQAISNALAQQTAAASAARAAASAASTTETAQDTTTPTFETLYADMLASGSPEAFLAARYKDYGLAYSQLNNILSAYNTWAANRKATEAALTLPAAGTGGVYGPPTPSKNTALSAAAQTAFSQVASVLAMGGSKVNASALLISLVEKGTITEAEAVRIANEIGM
jgi:hypothetical protein